MKSLRLDSLICTFAPKHLHFGVKTIEVFAIETHEQNNNI